MYISKVPQKEDNDVFQHGNCEFLARELFNAFDYSVMFLVDCANDQEYITNEDLFHLDYYDHTDFYCNYTDIYPGEDVPYIEICHCFAKAERDDKTYYIDSTGITDDINDILRNFGTLSLDTVETSDRYILFELEDPYEIKDRFWSTYYDWYGDSDFEEETQKYRVKPSKEFVEEYRDKLNIDKVLEKQRKIQRQSLVK